MSLSRAFVMLLVAGAAACGDVQKVGNTDAAVIDAPADTAVDAPVDSAPPLLTGTPGITASPGPDDTIGLCATGTFGWHFTPQVDIEVVNLGVFDTDPDGLIDSHEVALFDSTGAILRVTTVELDSPKRNGFRVAPIEPIALEANMTYVIAATNPGQAHTSGAGCSDTFVKHENDPAIIAVSDLISYGGSVSEDTTSAPNPTALVFPDQFGPTAGAFRIGPGFELVTP